MCWRTNVRNTYVKQQTKMESDQPGWVRPAPRGISRIVCTHTHELACLRDTRIMDTNICVFFCARAHEFRSYILPGAFFPRPSTIKVHTNAHIDTHACGPRRTTYIFFVRQTHPPPPPTRRTNNKRHRHRRHHRRRRRRVRIFSCVCWLRWEIRTRTGTTPPQQKKQPAKPPTNAHSPARPPSMQTFCERTPARTRARKRRIRLRADTKPCISLIYGRSDTTQRARRRGREVGVAVAAAGRGVGPEAGGVRARQQQSRRRERASVRARARNCRKW